MDNFSLEEFKSKLQQIVDSFKTSVQRVSVGRAHPALLDGISIEVNQIKMPLNQVASILVPEATTLKITAFDSNQINAIVEAIRDNSNCNFNLTDDGRSIYATVPPMTTERRQQVIKELATHQEDFLIRLRQQRHQVIKQIKEAQLSEDLVDKLNKQVDNLTADNKLAIESVTQAKTDEILKL